MGAKVMKGNENSESERLVILALMMRAGTTAGARNLNAWESGETLMAGFTPFNSPLTSRNHELLAGYLYSPKGLPLLTLQSQRREV